MRAWIRESLPGDLEAVVADARPADVAEMAALGFDFETALRASVERSHWTATGILDGRPLCLFGVAPGSLLSGVGVPWMLGTRRMEQRAVQLPFLRASRRVVAAMLATYPVLTNVVDARNTLAIGWLRWLGFEFDPAPVAVRGQQFHIFRKRAHV